MKNYCVLSRTAMAKIHYILCASSIFTGHGADVDVFASVAVCCLWKGSSTAILTWCCLCVCWLYMWLCCEVWCDVVFGFATIVTPFPCVHQVWGNANLYVWHFMTFRRCLQRCNCGSGLLTRQSQTTGFQDYTESA